tara:strand:- start:7780 stop:8034 length:255 start_codon:yes stop_codon:yes gene_type:complete
MKLSELFKEENWGWAVKGDKKPPAKPKPKKKKMTQAEIDQRIGERQEAFSNSTFRDRDIADELLEKQRKANLAKKTNARRRSST